MKPDEKIIGTAIRIEYEDHTGRLFVVFEITDPQYKNSIKADWTDDLEFKIVDRYLMI